MSWIISGILTIVMIVLIIKYNQKLILDKTELQQFSRDIKRLKAQKSDLQKDIEAQNSIIEEYNNKIINIQQKYDETNKKVPNKHTSKAVNSGALGSTVRAAFPL